MSTVASTERLARAFLIGEPIVFKRDDEAAGSDDIFVGRVRQDPSIEGDRGLAHLPVASASARIALTAAASGIA